jgi:hypothetical protein
MNQLSAAHLKGPPDSTSQSGLVILLNQSLHMLNSLQVLIISYKSSLKIKKSFNFPPATTVFFSYSKLAAAVVKGPPSLVAQSFNFAGHF